MVKKHVVLVPLFFIVLVLFVVTFFYVQFRGDDAAIFEDLKFRIIPVKESMTYAHNDTYPLILLHGHSSKESEYVRQSLSTFTKFQEKLDREQIYEGYGIVYPGEEKGLSDRGEWSNTSIPISIRTTYYVDFKDNPNLTIDLKGRDERNISVYAERLSSVIDTTIYRTGSKKVDVVAHSMGGLVLREYLRIYGDKKIGKVIMVGTPNKGVSGILTTRLCNFANPGVECLQMRAGSDFLVELNKKNISDYNISCMTVAGSCCKFCPLCNGRDFSDEVVIVRNVEVTGAVNLIINGSKGDTDVMHVEMVNPYIYPEVYDEIVGFLKR